MTVIISQSTASDEAYGRQQGHGCALYDAANTFSTHLNRFPHLPRLTRFSAFYTLEMAKPDLVLCTSPTRDFLHL